MTGKEGYMCELWVLLLSDADGVINGFHLKRLKEQNFIDRRTECFAFLTQLKSIGKYPVNHGSLSGPTATISIESTQNEIQAEH